MRPKKHKTTESNDLFRARLDQIINLKHELVLLAGKIDWDWIDGEIAPLYSENGRPGIETGVQRIVRWAAGASFTLYLVHLPIMIFFTSLKPQATDSLYGVLVCMIVVVFVLGF